MYKHGTNPNALANTHYNKQSIIARTIAYEILNLPHICETCGFTGRTHVHHINGDRDNNTRENIKILCVGCHGRIHFRCPPKKEKLLSDDMTVLLDRRFKLNPQKNIMIEKRRLATQRYREKWGIE